MIDQNITDQSRKQFWDCGYIVLKGVLSPDLCIQAKERSSTIESGKEQGKNVFKRTGRSGRALLVKIAQLTPAEPTFTALASHPALLRAIKALVGTPQVFRDVLVVKPAHFGCPLHFHQDAAYWDVQQPARALSAWIPLEDVSEEAGCLEVIPGSHLTSVRHDMYFSGKRLPKWTTRSLRRIVSLTGTGDNPKTLSQKYFARGKNFVLGTLTRGLPSLNDLNELRANTDGIPENRILKLPIKRGDVILFSSLLLHASGPNLTENSRHAYIVSYVSSTP